MKIMRDRSDSSKRTEDSDHKEALMFTLRSDDVRAVTKHAVNNMASSFDPNAHPYVLSNLFTGLQANVDLHNLLLESTSAGEEKRERIAELGHQLEAKIELVSEPPQGTTTITTSKRNATALVAGGGANFVDVTHYRWRTSSNFENYFRKQTLFRKYSKVAMTINH